MAINVMVTAHGVVGDHVRTSLHMFDFETEEQLEEWFAKAPVKQKKLDDGPDIHVEIPTMNKRRKE